MEEKKVDYSTIKGFSDTIIKYKGSITKFLNPKYGITAEDFIETCIRVVRETPKLLQCDPKSLFGSILFCAEIGLKPNTPLGHAYILPYKGKAKFQIGYKGLIEIMYRNPRVKQITARAVFQNDFFEYNYGLKPDLVHKPARTEKGKLECVYATCLVDNEPVFVVVEKAELDEIKKISPSFNSEFAKQSAYNNGTDIHNWMEIKAGVKALSKLIPTSNNIEMAKAVEYDSRFEGGAMALVEIPSNPNDVVEPKLLGGNFQYNNFDSAFDSVNQENTIVENTSNAIPIQQQFQKTVKEESELFEIPEEEVHSKIVKPQVENKEVQKPELEVAEPQIKKVVETPNTNDNFSDSDIDFELPIDISNDNLEENNNVQESSFKSEVEFDSFLEQDFVDNSIFNEDDDDDISFDFPDGEDDDDDDDDSSGMF
jgi:recombination protein RecT